MNLLVVENSNLPACTTRDEDMFGVFDRASCFMSRSLAFGKSDE